MEQKRSSGSEEDGCAPKRRRKKFTEVEATPKVEPGHKYGDESLSDEYQPQFFDYQLIGDSVAVAILHSKDLIIQKSYYVPVQFVSHLRFCNVAWSVADLLRELKSKKRRYPIAKKVILSVGYNDYRSDTMNAAMFVECLEKTVEKLRRRGCREIILTNVPPCSVECDSLSRWKYLQIVNEEISKLCQKHDYIGHCDVFKLFCRPINIFSRSSDYVTCSEINFKVDFSMFNVVGGNGEIDPIGFSNVAKIVLGKHVALTVEKRGEYLRYGPVDKVICVLREASDVDDSDSEVEAVEIVETKDVNKCQATVNLDSCDEDDADGDRGLKIKSEMPGRPVKRKTSSSLDDSNERIPSCEMPPVVISCSIKCVARDVKVEKSCEMPAEGTQMKRRVISCSIVRVGDIKDEKMCELPQKETIVQETVDDVEKSELIKQEIVQNVEKLEPVEQEIVWKVEKLEPVEQEIVGNIEPLEPVEQEIVRNVEKLEPVEQEIVGNIETSKLVQQEIVRNVEKSEPVEQEIVQNVETLKPVEQEMVPNIEKSEPVEQEIVQNVEISEPVEQEIVQNVEISEPVEQEIVRNVEISEPVEPEMVGNIPKSEPAEQEIVGHVSSDDIKDEKGSWEIREKDERFQRVILCDFQILDPAVGQPSCKIPQDGQPSSYEKVDGLKDEKLSDEMFKEDPSFRRVIGCSIQRVDVEDEVFLKCEK